MIPLDVQKQATMDANGRAVAELVPTIYGYRWHITRMYVTSNSSLNKPEARVYNGYEAFSRQIGTTYNGNEDSSNEDFTLKANDRLVCVWSLGDAGALCVFGLIGQILAWNES